jgi:SAM-dependent methyltransferase
MRKGPGVDILGNVEDLPMEDNSVGTVIALNLFEHVRCFWKGFDEVYRVLRPGGAFFVSCPFFLHRHSYPNDYWRFTPDAFAYLLEKYPQKLIGFQGPANKPLQVWAIAFKDPAPIITPELHQQFQSAMRIYAHQPVSKWRKLRYSLGRMICGRSPFATFLDMNNWETTVIGSSEKNSTTSATTPKANLTQTP